MVNSIVAFYSGYRADSAGRTLDEIWGWNHERLEGVHDYIQWLFPLRTRSQFNPDAPVLDDSQIRAFQKNTELQCGLLKSLDVMLEFYGFTRKEGRISQSDSWPDRSRNWLTPGNHNFLGITRILTSLSTLGLEEHAAAFFEALKETYTSAGYTDVIGHVRGWTEITCSFRV